MSILENVYTQENYHALANLLLRKWGYAEALKRLRTMVNGEYNSASSYVADYIFKLDKGINQ